MNGAKCMAQAVCPVAMTAAPSSLLRHGPKLHALSGSTARSTKLSARARKLVFHTMAVNSTSTSTPTSTSTSTYTAPKSPDPLTSGVTASVVVGTVVIAALLFKSVFAKTKKQPPAASTAPSARPLAARDYRITMATPTGAIKTPSAAKALAMRKVERNEPFLPEDLAMYEAGLKGTSGDVLVQTINALSIQSCLIVELLPRLGLTDAQLTAVLPKLRLSQSEKEKIMAAASS